MSVYKNCHYLGCDNKNVSEMRVFYFPVSDKARCCNWIASSGRDDFNELTNKQLKDKRICSKHFEEKHFTNELKNKLNKNAVPIPYCKQEINTSDTVKSTNLETPTTPRTSSNPQQHQTTLNNNTSESTSKNITAGSPLVNVEHENESLQEFLFDFNPNKSTPNEEKVVKLESEFSDKVFEKLTLKVQTMSEHERDEISIKKNLQYDPTQGLIERFQDYGPLRRSNKSSGDVISSRTSSFTTTSATTTSCTTSSITTTSLTTVSVTTTFSTATTPSTSIFSSVYLPSTSGFQTSFIKEEMDIGLDEINSEPDQDDFAELESTDQINQYGNEAEGNSCEEDESGEREEEALSDVLHTTDSFDSKLRNILTDNIFKFCDINPTFSQIPPEIPSPRHSSEPQSTVKLKYFELEQKLRLYYLKTMIRKEEELMNIKIQLYKAQLIREKAEAENNRIINTCRMDNLNIENKMLNLQLQILVK